jgi:hypothetical protein
LHNLKYAGRRFLTAKSSGERIVTRTNQQLVAMVLGIVCVAILLLPTLGFSSVTPSQLVVFRVGLALTASGVAAMSFSFFNVRTSRLFRAATAAVVCLALYVVGLFLLPTPSNDLAQTDRDAGGQQEVGSTSPKQTGNQTELQTIKQAKSRFGRPALAEFQPDEVLPGPVQTIEDRRRKTLLRLEVDFHTTRSAQSAPDAVTVEVLKGTTVVGSATAHRATKVPSNSQRSAALMFIPPTIFDNDCSLKIKNSGTSGWAFQLDQIKGFFADGKATVLHGRSAEIRYQAGQEVAPLFPLRRA